MVSLSHLTLMVVSVDEGTQRAAYKSEGFFGCHCSTALQDADLCLHLLRG